MFLFELISFLFYEMVACVKAFSQVFRRLLGFYIF